MVNQEILIALKNGINRGESLEEAMQILVNSGYNPKEVQEVSESISGILAMGQPKAEEQLIMPEKKHLLGLSKEKFREKSRYEAQKYETQSLAPKQPAILPDEIGKPALFAESQIEQKSYAKEIILVIILIILIGILALTVLFKNNIAGWFS